MIRNRTMIKNRINKLGRMQIENAVEIIICKDNAYFLAKFGTKQSRFDPDLYIAMGIYKNGNNSLINSGDYGHWRFAFEDIENAIRSVKRINKHVPINIYTDEQIIQFVENEEEESKKFMAAVRDFNKGIKQDLINILKADKGDL